MVSQLEGLDMTETRIGQYTPFEPHPAHRAMTPDDAEIFECAADMYVHPKLYGSILSVGGDDSHIAHFSRTHCSNRPVSPWADDQTHETVVALLKATGEALK
jgi:hypothetical protein